MADARTVGHRIQRGREMTPEQREAVAGLLIMPGEGRKVTPERVLSLFNTDDGKIPVLALLDEAIARRDADELGLSLLAGFTFGFSHDCIEPLVRLCNEDWHQSHEDIVDALDGFHSAKAVHALHQVTQWVPEYLEWDDARALATKAIWALGKIPGPQAGEALVRLLNSDSEILREAAQGQVERRAAEA
ncbi:HEAT repeat domain-containing protein [Nonomuraea sp. NPDC050478]|uniref:HEAT repeat domain-containing protein n=1 Tax=Nonomuraea sp. NPDC050478 TaxID=3364365 RepID=UPI0037B334FC